MPKYKKLVVLDFSTSTTHIYTCLSSTEIDEDYVRKLGFKDTECSWMEGDIEVIHHKGVLI